VKPGLTDGEIVKLDGTLDVSISELQYADMEEPR
jgi:hypothetical protein